jgi:predicted helicase
MHEFTDVKYGNKEIAQRFGLPLFDKDQWNLARARRDIGRVYQHKIRRILYRPFDFRFIYYDELLVARMNRRVLHHLDELKDNRGLILGRQGMATGAETWDVCLVCNGLVDQNIFRRGGGTVFPLRLASDTEGLNLADCGINFSRDFIAQFADSRASNDDIFKYIYGVFYSPTYRARYAEFLKIDFPHVPLTRDVELFRALVRLGGDLVALHLLESPMLNRLVAEFIGGQNREVEKISWSRKTVWVDKAQTTGFRGVSEAVWNFHIGGYQVCEKWLKDRKGRTLSKDDIAHYQKIVVALAETIRLMTRIDEVIEAHGGWPGAFQSVASTDAAIARQPQTAGASE